MKLPARNFSNWNFNLLAVLLLAAVVSVSGCSEKKTEESAGTSAQLAFATPEEAGKALAAAARTDDENAIGRILGSNWKTVLSSGDPVEDKAGFAEFAAKYDQLNRWVAMTDGTQVLNIGPDNFPFPIPLSKDASSKWHFDEKAGQEEVLARIIGRRELLAIDACSSIANAEELYFKQGHDGNPPHQYTTKIMSSPGKQDGLHWHAPEDQVSSPLGRLSDFPKDSVSSTAPADQPVFDGYSFRILTAQGDKAKGGAKNYIVNGRLTGFAVIGAPVKYRETGIKTFIISREGVVYEKDLGPNTVEAATAIKEYNPTDGWTPAE